MQLLDERRLCLSLSINRKELVFVAGLGFLWQTLGLKRDSKLAKESQKLLRAVMQQLEPESAEASAEFDTLANCLVTLDNGRQGSAASSNQSQSQEMAAPSQRPSKSPKKHLQALKARLTPSASGDQPKQDSASRRNTVSGTTPPLAPQSLRSSSWTSLPPSQSEPVSAPDLFRGHSSLDLASDPRLAPSLSYDYTRGMSCSTSSDVATGAITMSDWEYVLGDMDRGYSNIFNGIYGGRECGEDAGPFASITAEYNQKVNDGVLKNDLHDLSPEAWSASSAEYLTKQENAQSVLSYSGESMGSAEENSLAFADVPPGPDDMMNLLDPFRGIAMPAEDEIDEFALVNGWERRLAV